MMNSSMHLTGVTEVMGVEFQGQRLERCDANVFNINASTPVGTLQTSLFISYEQLRAMRDAIDTYLEEQGEQYASEEVRQALKEDKFSKMREDAEEELPF